MEQLCNATPASSDNDALQSVIGPLRPALLVKTFMFMNFILILVQTIINIILSYHGFFSMEIKATSTTIKM